jgi:hypothetical protein
MAKAAGQIKTSKKNIYEMLSDSSILDFPSKLGTRTNPKGAGYR